jgi:5-methylcytosine-specific restriction endonuclease McrA
MWCVLAECSIETCASLAKARGWCNAHYLRWFNHGDPVADFTRRRKPCLRDGCDVLSYGLGLCPNHYKQVQYQRNPEKYRGWERQRRVTQAEVVRAKDRERHARNPTRARVASTNRKARIRGAIGTFTEAQWRQRLAEFNGRCVYCGDAATSRDHAIPVSRGGTNTIDNILPACLTCNLRKHDKTPDEFRAVLARYTRAA